MRSTTGKLIRFTLQRTPTWAWAGPVLVPFYLETPKWLKEIPPHGGYLDSMEIYNREVLGEWVEPKILPRGTA